LQYRVEFLFNLMQTLFEVGSLGLTREPAGTARGASPTAGTAIPTAREPTWRAASRTARRTTAGNAGVALAGTFHLFQALHRFLQLFHSLPQFLLDFLLANG
jgi:hypothetical protein